MQGLPWKKQARLELCCPSPIDEIEIKPGIGPIDLVPDQRVSEPLGMGPNLVLAAGAGPYKSERKAARTAEGFKAGYRGLAVAPHSRLDENLARRVVAEGLIHRDGAFQDARQEGQVGFLHPPFLDGHLKTACSPCVLRKNNNPACLPIEPKDKMDHPQPGILPGRSNEA
jgi:hypothetical protein